MSSTKNTKNNTKSTTLIKIKALCSLCFVVSFVLLLPNKTLSQQTEKLYLSGTGNDNTINWQFFCTAGMNSGKWTTIPVPSCWELQGFGKYDYGFAKDTIRGKEKGLYKHSFTVPAAWKNKKINIVFEGSMTDTEVKINGKSAGAIHQGAFYAFRYDISRLLKYGSSNLLEVTVAKHSANESVNAAERRADFWIFGGIFRPVWLEALPQEHISNLRITTGEDGFTAHVNFQGKKADGLAVQLYTLSGEKVGKAGEKYLSGSFADISIIATYRDKAIKKWSPESPNLYIAEFSLTEKGNPVHTIRQRIGFRTVELKQRDGIYINGVKIKFKGVNRHSFYPTSGRTTSKKISIDDVLLMKDMNMNAVRMSHYPPDDHFLDVCDSLGLFVMDELAGWHGHYDTPTGTKLLKEMIDHDHNHPSIVMWANGNEGGHNFDLDSLFTAFDLQARPVVHPWQLFNGVETQHYREYNYGIGNYDHGHDIVMPTEFLHGQFDGGHGAGLEDYWEAMWRKPLSAGGFLWDFADQAVVRKDKNDSLDTDKHRAADGIVGPYHEKEASFYAIKEIWSPVYFEEKEITPEFDGKLIVENRFSYTNINQCSIMCTFKKFENGAAELTVPVVPVSIDPSEKGPVWISMPANWRDYTAMFITVSDQNGNVIITKSFPIVRPPDYHVNLIGSDGPAPGLTDTNGLFVVKANGIELAIEKRTGLLLGALNEKGPIPFGNGPVIEEGATNFQGITAKQEGNTILITSAFDRKNSYNTLQWTIYPSGIVKLQVNYFPAAYFTSMVGINFACPETKIKSIEYLGNGPYRVWKNRMKGNQLGIWKKEYNNTETGEYPWVYPEFKGYHSNLYWCKFIAKDGQSFKVSTTNDDLFLRLFTPAWKTDQWHNYEPIFPSGDISFMQGIPSIGSKTQRNETTGPMGSKNIFYDYEKDPSRALKMTLFFDFSGK